MSKEEKFRVLCDYCLRSEEVPYDGASPEGWVWAHFEIDSRVDICPTCQDKVSVTELRRVLPPSGHDRNKHSPEAIQIFGV